MALEKESAYFDAHRDEWLQHYRGQFALVYGEELLGTFTQFDEAFVAGVERIGNRPFLIRQITDQPASIQFPALVVGMIGARS
jgi:hypothetical protein